ncbi:MAG: aspartate 1-decarboxylase [Deltaproteobacteria bacterium]|nr:aspartate 1-decarboxylase [Deltaproteobacteria bacterium]MDL1972486.1 aspartate 1-decarboxylase [Deltaproteobacteria bacterium]
MLYFMLKSKIHRAHITKNDLNYEGSITIDRELMKTAEIVPYEMVHVYNISNGERFSTYVLPGEAGEICLNGAAARKGEVGDVVIVAAYTLVEKEKIGNHKPIIVSVNKDNAIERISFGED